jgi:signal transduction histidine kinase
VSPVVQLDAQQITLEATCYPIKSIAAPSPRSPSLTPAYSPSIFSTIAPIISAPYCQLRIVDNGIGFDQKYLDRIFTVFHRLHDRQDYQGTGMGLAICRKIVERHRGHITAESQVGEGTTFIVTLPMQQRLAPASPYL